ncbi:MAG: prepilin-type N-terminal cleavage/methylation domain-containing protein, partial [Betaproteobacteria bacterium]|nr:prepilin-type N-terminal cleavage/methylation domain-containing protein [Betaproteobacteria bacterium]
MQRLQQGFTLIELMVVL